MAQNDLYTDLGFPQASFSRPPTAVESLRQFNPQMTELEAERLMRAPVESQQAALDVLNLQRATDAQRMNAPIPAPITTSALNFTPGPTMPAPMQAPMASPAPQVPTQPQTPIAPTMPAQQPFGLNTMEDALLRSAQLQTQAGQGMMQAQQEAARAEQTAIQKQIDAARNAEEELRKQREDYDLKVAPAIQSLQTLGQEIQGAEYKNFWAKASTPQKIGASLAVALGAMGSGLTGAPNFAQQIIDKAVEDDLKEWQTNIDNKNKAFLNQRQYISDLKQTFQDRQQMLLAQKALAYDQVNAQLMQIAAKNKEAAARPAFQQLQANIIDNRNKQYLELAKLKAETAKLEREARGTSDQKMENFVPGLGFAYSSQGANEMRTLVSDTNAARSSIARLVEISQLPAKSLTPTLRAEADTIRSTLRGQLRTILVGPGAVTETEQKLLDSVIADPTTIFSFDKVNQVRLNALQTALDRKLKSAAEANIMGFQPSQQQQPSPTQAVQQAGQQQQITPALKQQAQAQLNEANRRLSVNPNDAQAKQIRDRANLILGQ